MKKQLPAPFTCFFLLFFCLFTFAAHAAEPFVQISAKPAWVNSVAHVYKKPKLKSVSGGFLYSLLEEQIHVEKQASFNHIIREIVSEAGIQNGSNISVSFDPAYEQLEFHQITVWRNNQPQNRLSQKAFKLIADEEDLQRFIYQGTYSAFLILDDIRKGDQIEYSYTVTGRNPIFKGKYASTMYFQGYEPITHLYTSLIVGGDRNLQFKSFNAVPKVRVSEAGGQKRYEWESFDAPAPVIEDYQPSWFNNLACVEVSEYKSWGEVVNWAAEINPVASSLSGKSAQYVKEIERESKGSKTKFFREAVRRVQDDIRYMGVETGEFSHRANAPDRVIEQRYGDCKDKSLLLASILRAGGIPAYLALINTRLRGKLADVIPASTAFNHVVVVAELGGRKIWIDPTINYQGGTGTDIFFPLYGKALIVRPGNNSLSNIDALPKGRIVCKEKYTVADEKSKVRLDVVTKYNLNQADDMRAELASSSFDETAKSYFDYYSKLYPELTVQDSMNVSDDRELNEITITESYLIDNFFLKDSATQLYTAGFYANFIKNNLPAIAANRKNPVSIDPLYDIDYTIEVEMESGWNIPTEHATIYRNGYSFTRDIYASQKVLSISYQFTFLDEYVNADKAAEFAGDIRQLANDKLSYNISYRTGIQAGITNTNYWMVLFAVLLTGALIYTAIRLYRRETFPSEEYTGYAPPIGGWLILVAIGLCATPFTVGYSLLTNSYFTETAWQYYPASGNTFLFKIALVFELVVNVISICLSGFCVYLLFKRRDILPKFVIAFYVINLGGLIIDYFLVLSLGIDTSNLGSSIIRIAIAAVIWIPYFRMSVRVQETFVVPFPDRFLVPDENNEENEAENVLPDFNIPQDMIPETATEPGGVKTLEVKEQ